MHIPGQTLDLIVLYQGNKTVNDLGIDSAEPSPQPDLLDPSKIFLFDSI